MFARLVCAAAFAVNALVTCVTAASADEPRQFLIAPFLCTDASPVPVFARTRENFLHEYRGATQIEHQACAKVPQFQILAQGPAPLRTECTTLSLSSYRVMCRGGAVSAARWWAASDQARSSGARIDGETLLIPFQGGGGWSVSSNAGGISGLGLGNPTTSYAALPGGYGPSLGLPVRTLTLPWKSLATSVGVATTAEAPAPASPGVQHFADWWPWPQLVIGLPLLGYALIAFIGLQTAPSTFLTKLALLVSSFVALAGIANTHLPAGIPDEIFRSAKHNLATARANAAELARIVRLSAADGMVEPIAVSDAARIARLMSSPIAPDMDVQPGRWLPLFLSPALFVIVVFSLPFIRGWHYLFVAHPAAPVVGPPLRSGALFEPQALGAVLRPRPADLHVHPPAFESRSQTLKAHALRERIDADAEIADAAMRRDRARAQKMQAEADLREARKKLPWWRRWLWW